MVVKKPEPFSGLLQKHGSKGPVSKPMIEETCPISHSTSVRTASHHTASSADAGFGQGGQHCPSVDAQKCHSRPPIEEKRKEHHTGQCSNHVQRSKGGGIECFPDEQQGRRRRSRCLDSTDCRRKHISSFPRELVIAHIK
jgi:hypothetical protein